MNANLMTCNAKAQGTRFLQRLIGNAVLVLVAVGLLGGYFAGTWLEGRYGHAPWFSFGGLVLGGVASVRKMVQILNEERRRKSRRPRS